MKYAGPIIDVDVHHSWATAQEFLEYLPVRWRDFVARPAPQGPMLGPVGHIRLFHPGGHNLRADAFGPSGQIPGSDIESMREQLLDRCHVTDAVLTYNIGLESGVTNPYLATALTRAANDWCIDRWLDGRDRRLHGSILVATELPDEAAGEIRRLADHPGMVEVLIIVSALGKPLGHPVYHPIFEAATEVGLPVGVHLGTDILSKAQHTGGGAPGSRLEQFVTNDQPGMHHLSSFVTHGVFDKFPTLRVMMKEHGFAWVPWVVWRLDALVDLLRTEHRNMTRLPSEYVRDHMLFSTQPFDYTDDPAQMVELIESFDGMSDILAFASDYPHWDGDEPGRFAGRIPAAWHRKIFHDNAARHYGWPAAAQRSSEPALVGSEAATGDAARD